MTTKKQIIAIIPARGGSKRVFKKNIKYLNGKPLIAYTIEASLNSKLVDRTFVSTDDDEISEIAMEYGAEVILRPKEISRDDSTTEETILHVIAHLRDIHQEIDYIIILQPTSPLRGTDVIDDGISLMLDSDADSLVSVCEVQHYYLMGHFEGESYKLEYDDRPFSHETQKKYRENGALFVIKYDFFYKTHKRLGGKIIAIKMDEIDSIDIDDAIDFKRVERILKTRKYE